MSEKCSFYFCEISDPEKDICDESDFYKLMEHIKDNYSLEDKDSDLVGEQNCVLIAFARMKDLHDQKTFNNMTKAGLRSISSPEREEVPQDYTPRPIILIGLEDIIDWNHSDKIIKALNLDPRFRFWDSSIWHRYVPLNENFDKNFSNALKEIKGYLSKGLYTTFVAREFLEFQARMFLNSYLTGEGGHALEVIPYRFHSEAKMKKRADEELIEIRKAGENLRWRFLLIDDYGNAPLKPATSLEITKKKIIESLIKNVDICAPGAENGGSASNVIEWAFEKLQSDNNMYDIILLDYLLGPSTEKKGREKGSDFLERLDSYIRKPTTAERLRLRRNKGPVGKFWIFPISVFSHAMLDEIHQKGIGHISDNWYLAAGADPVNTPQLFRYNLYRFMNLQIKIAPEDLSKFMKCSFVDTEEDTCKAARSCYPYFIKLRSEYDILQNDVNQGSSFAKTIQKKLGEKIPQSIWEHLSHLIYLLAYGAGIEWPVMWEEYNYIKQYFNRGRTPKFMTNIRNYIVSLKSS